MNNQLSRSTINMVSSLIGYAIPMVIALVSTPFLLKALGIEAYGVQSMVGVIIGYVALMDLGLSQPIIKYLAADNSVGANKSRNSLVNTTFIISTIIGIVGLIIILLSSNWLASSAFKVPPDLVNSAKIVFFISGFGFLGSMWMSWGRAVMMGLQRFDLNYGVSVPMVSLGTIFGIAVVYAGYGIVGYVFTRTLFVFLSVPIYYSLIKYSLQDYLFDWRIDMVILKRIRAFVGYSTINRIISSLVSRLDQTLLGVWAGVGAVGVYSVPFLLANSFGYMLAFMLGFIFPMASELQSLGQYDRLRDVFVRATKFITSLAGMIYFPIFILGDIILFKWVPSIAQSSAGVLHLLLLAGYIGTIMVTIANHVMVGLGHMRQFTIYSTIRAIVLAISCFFFIPSMGVMGAGWALLITSSVDVVFFAIVLKRFLKISFLQIMVRAYFKPIALSASLGLIIWLSRPFIHSWTILFGVIAIYEFLYISIGYWIGVFGETEKRAIIGLLQSISR